MTASRPNDDSSEKLPATSDFKELYQMTSRTRPVAANDNVLPVTLPNNLCTQSARTSADRLATKFLAANDNTPPKGRSPAYRGGRPAFNWAAKHDEYGAACLWLIARQRLPAEEVSANDNAPQGGLDVRRNGVARGPSKAKRNLGAHLAIPAVISPLGSDEPQPVAPAGHSRVEVKEQNTIRTLSKNFRCFASCGDSIPTHGVDFIGAKSGLGSPRPGKSRGSPLKVDEPDFSEAPAEVDFVIELILSRSNVADIGAAFGATGRYQDKKGAALIAKAMAWAKACVEETNYRASVTNRVASLS
ncbi:hypothetical protein HFO27_13460 [Rhizobium leguminosarum]|uniref:hypothetical protein n=1 Tax=Rhizobium leguminosarum TaxID=384 RepID=UPI001C90F45F|nr:hypothetical protein [Rhizobium leguminosarum]MBY3175639.1 hypothetical protein [Rhizobium leguminosarum]